MTDVDDFFKHHGIKGMHWGRRKEGSSSTDHHTRNVAAGSLVASVALLRYTTLKPALVIAGAGAAGVILAKNHNKKLSEL